MGGDGAPLLSPVADLMPRPRIARLFDHTARLWRLAEVLGPLREREDVLQPVTSFRCAVDRPGARLGDPGPGLITVGERYVYVETSVDLRARDVLELTDGPDVGQLLEIDETPTNVRNHHKEATARIYNGQLPDDEGAS